MKIKRVCVLGGNGFVGGYLIPRLANTGCAVCVPTRHRERRKKLLVMPNVQLVQVDTLDQDTLLAQFDSCDAVINLVGILNGSEAEFAAAHVELTKRIVDACRQAGVTRLLHMSALNADAEKGPSRYLRSKGAGEDIAHSGAEHGIRVTSFRPSVIFGPGDGFFNRFAGLLALSPVLPLACADARFAPVYVEDVVTAFCKALLNDDMAGERLELCGPRIYALKELVEYTAKLIGRKRLVWGLSDGLARLQGKIFEKLPGQPFTTDNYLSLQVDSVCSSNGFAAIGIAPKSVEAIVPHYFAGGRRARYGRFRSASRR